MKNQIIQLILAVSLSSLGVLVLISYSKNEDKVSLQTAPCIDENFDLATSLINEDVESVYKNPERQEYCPVALTASEVQSTLEDASSKLGFKSVYYSRKQLNKMMDSPESMGIVFFTAQPPEAVGNEGMSLLGIGVTEQRDWIYNSFSNKYKYSNCIDGYIHSNKISNLSNTEAQEYVQKAHGATDNPKTAAYFSKSIINKVLDVEGADGIHVIPGKFNFSTSRGNTSEYSLIITAAYIKEGQSVVFASVSNSKESGNRDSKAVRSYAIQESGKTYFGSKLPCPPNCRPRQLFEPN